MVSVRAISVLLLLIFFVLGAHSMRWGHRYNRRNFFTRRRWGGIGRKWRHRHHHHHHHHAQHHGHWKSRHYTDKEMSDEEASYESKSVKCQAQQESSESELNNTVDKNMKTCKTQCKGSHHRHHRHAHHEHHHGEHHEHHHGDKHHDHHHSHKHHDHHHHHHHHRHGRGRSKFSLLHLAHHTSSTLKSNLQPMHDLSIERAAVTSSLIISSISLVAVLLIPFASALTKFLLPFAAGALLSDLVYHLLPHMYESSNASTSSLLLISVAVFAFLDIILRRITSVAEGKGEEQKEEEVEKSEASEEDKKKDEAEGEQQAAEVPGEQQEGSSENNEDDEVTAEATTTPNEQEEEEITAKTVDSTEDEHTESASERMPLADGEAVPKKRKSIAVSAYINLAADALHNFCDGLTLAAAYRSSSSAGVATTIAIILHEIPQEMSDFALLTKAGMSTRLALIANVACALTALLGTIVGLRITEIGGESIMPVAAGALLYMTFASVIPDVVDDIVKGHGESRDDGILAFLGRIGIAGVAASCGVAVVGAIESVHEH